METVESLSSILSGKGESAAPAVAEPASPAVEPAKTETVEPESRAQTRDDSGRFAKEQQEPPKAEVKAEPARAADPKSEPMVPLSALLAERARRKAPEAKGPKADFWDDPEKALSERLTEHVEPLRSENFQLQLEVSKLRYPDFDDAVMAFLKASQADEVLKWQADNSPNPLQFIYREGKRLKTLEPYGGDFGKYSESITADLTKKLSDKDVELSAARAEIESLKKAQANLESIPRSLNKGNEGAPRSTAEADPDDLNSLVRFKAKTG